MYPLNVVLVGATETMLIDVRRELDGLSAAVEAEYSDVANALTGLAGMPHHKRLVIVHLSPRESFKSLERLVETFPGQPLLALVDADHDGASVLQAMRAGATQVVPAPVDAGDFRAALHRIAVQYGQPVSDATIIAVSGVSEGCGATTVAVNLAAEIARVHRQPTILVELAPHLGRLASSYLNIEPRFTLHDLLSDVDRLDLESVRRALTRVAENFLVLAGPYEAIVPASPTPESVARLLQLLRQLGSVLIIDMPYTFDTLYFETLALAHRLVLVTDQKVPSLHALKLLLETLVKRETTGTPQVVVNRYDASLEAFSVKHIKELLPLPGVMTIANDYVSLTASANEGQPLAQSAPACRPLRDIDRLAVALLGPPPAADAKKPAGSILSRLLHPFRS